MSLFALAKYYWFLMGEVLISLVLKLDFNDQFIYSALLLCFINLIPSISSFSIFILVSYDVRTTSLYLIH